MRYRFLLPLLAVLALVSLLAALAAGSVPMSAAQLLNALLHPQAAAGPVIWQLRGPRALSAFLVGALLALAGAKMQVLVRNPLADPYVLGVSGGAAVGALTTLMLGGSHAAVSLAAIAGALLSMLLVFGVAHGRGSWSATRLLLTGVVIAAGWGALISFLLSISADTEVRGMLFWLMGDLGYTTPPWWGALVLLVALAIGWWLARDLNVLSYGELQARVLGVNVAGVRVLLYLLASVLTAVAVSIAGTVGFVGLVVPHMLRLVAGGDHRGLLPGCVLAGGTLLVIADTVARTVIAPQQLPVGVISAFIGVPAFLVILHRGATGYRL